MAGCGGEDAPDLWNRSIFKQSEKAIKLSQINQI